MVSDWTCSTGKSVPDMYEYFSLSLRPLWCDRCRRSYRSYAALSQHLRDSPKHHECPVCTFDATTWDGLLQHCRDRGCRTVCKGCGIAGCHWRVNADEYWQHVRNFNVCTDCEKHFTSPGHLYQHRLSHRKHTYQCYMCANWFKTYSGMIIHLEYGACSHIDRIELNRIAAECNVCHRFIDLDYIQELWYGDTCYGDPFKCPTCYATFSKLSSLFQHIESSACAQTLDENGIDELRNHLAIYLSEING